MSNISNSLSYLFRERKNILIVTENYARKSSSPGSNQKDVLHRLSRSLLLLLLMVFHVVVVGVVITVVCGLISSRAAFWSCRILLRRRR